MDRPAYGTKWIRNLRLPTWFDTTKNPPMKPRNLSEWKLTEAAHLLNRAGFGGSPQAIRDLHALGPDKAVEKLIAGEKPESDPLPPPAWANEEAYRRDAQEFMEMRRQVMEAERAAGSQDPEAARKQGEERMKMQRQMRQEAFQQGGELTRWWVRRMIRGPHPLQEKMVLFWHGHFASSMEKVRSAYFLYKQNDLFRTQALGSFGDLAKGIVRDPAMMVYLDIQQSRKQMPNENFAREVMELFTLGEGNYSEDDIRQAARAFTGLRLDRQNGKSSFAAFQHDNGEKTFFGKKGLFGPDDIIDILLQQEACPKFMARKFWRFFVNDGPTDEDVAQLAAVLRKENFHIGKTLRTLFLSEAFYDKRNIRAEIKSPVVFLVQLARQLEIDDLPLAVLAGSMREMGQQLFFPPNVAGWPGGAAWITTNTLFARYNVAGTLVRSNDPDFAVYGGPAMEKLKDKPKAAQAVKELRNRARRDWPKPDFAKLAPASLRQTPEKLVEDLAFRFYQSPLRAEDRSSFLEFVQKEATDGLTDLEVGKLVHLMLSTPNYQLS